MTATTLISNYDQFAQFYNAYWGKSYCDGVFPMFESLLSKYVSQSGQILELGCGTGHLAKQLQEKGYQVTGLDQSEAMLKYARLNSSESQFIVGDIHSFKFPPTFHGVISTSVFNHVMSLADLITVFGHVYQALLPNGVFIFNLTQDAWYRSHWHGHIDEGDIHDDYAWATRVSYNEEEKTGQVQVTMFQRDAEHWRRSDVTWRVKSHSTEEIQSTLGQVGFTMIETYNEEDFPAGWNAGNQYFVCSKPAN
jgi:SAM-dependent methyltransferase